MNFNSIINKNYTLDKTYIKLMYGDNSNKILEKIDKIIETFNSI